MEEQEVTASGRDPPGQALAVPATPASGRDASRFDPSRVEMLIEAERMVLDMLDDAYRQNKMHYLHFSPAWDVTQARIAAMSWVLADLLARRDRDRGGEADETRNAAQPEARARAEGIAQGDPA